MSSYTIGNQTTIYLDTTGTAINRGINGSDSSLGRNNTDISRWFSSSDFLGSLNATTIFLWLNHNNVGITAEIAGLIASESWLALFELLNSTVFDVIGNSSSLGIHENSTIIDIPVVPGVEEPYVLAVYPMWMLPGQYIMPFISYR